MTVAAIGLLYNGLGVVRIPVQPFSQDTYRYVKQIENEFEGEPLGTVLLDAGTWVYLRGNVVMKDRAPSIGEQGISATGDFSGILQRINRNHYSKILVRHLHSPNFWYDHYMWPISSGIKQALLRNYQESHRLPAVKENDSQPIRYLFSDISVLIPKTK